MDSPVIRFQETQAPGYLESLRVGVYAGEGGEPASWAGARTVETMYCGQPVRTLIVGGVGTRPEYRRQGHVRLMLDRLFDMAPEKGWEISLLHPFSFSYYHKFGYERVADHKILEFPMAALENFPRCGGLVPYSEDRLADTLAVYRGFAAERNLLFVRNDATRLTADRYVKDAQTYLWYGSDGAPAGYIMLQSEKTFEINRNVSVNLHVYELAYTCREALLALIGFIRMFEGENDTVKLHNMSMCPEFEALFRHYTHLSCRIVPDVAGRILNPERFLRLNQYPRQPGHFRLKVEDAFPWGRGVFEVAYGDGRATVRRLLPEDAYDIRLPAASLCPLFYGYGVYDSYSLPYIPGAEFCGQADDFLRAFPPRRCGVWEHF